MAPGLDISYSNASETNGFHHSVKSHKKRVDGFGIRAIHVGSEPNEETGAVIPSISLSTTYKQSAIGVHKGCSCPSIRIRIGHDGNHLAVVGS